MRRAVRGAGPGWNGGGGLPLLREGRRQPPALVVRAEPAADCRAEAADGGSARDRSGRCPSALHARSRPQPGAEAGLVSGATERREALVEVYREASGCTLCPLAETRTKVVFGAGNADADLMFVGEAPGAEEDRQGLPFVGRAGGLLDKLLEGAGMARDEVMVVNVLKCRPPGNRDPRPEEIETCRPYLERQVELIQPRVIATLGNFAT